MQCQACQAIPSMIPSQDSYINFGSWCKLEMQGLLFEILKNFGDSRGLNNSQDSSKRRVLCHTGDTPMKPALPKFTTWRWEFSNVHMVLKPKADIFLKEWRWWQPVLYSNPYNSVQATFWNLGFREAFKTSLLKCKEASKHNFHKREY